MDVRQLLDLAKKKCGTYGAIANAIGKPKSRISEFKNGRCQPNASEVVTIALIAELPVWETLAEIECQQHPALAGVWTKVMGTRVKR